MVHLKDNYKLRNMISDDKIIACFLDRNETALKWTDQKYGAYIRTISSNFLLDERDVEECISDTYASLWNHIPPDKPKSLCGYISVIAKNISLDKYRRLNRLKRIPSEYCECLEELSNSIGDITNVENEVLKDEFQNAINSFVKELPSKKRYIFIARYYFGDSAKKIATALSISESTVFKNIAEMSGSLKKSLIKGGFLNER